MGRAESRMRSVRSGLGFTLIELAIVLFVVTLLLGGVLTPLGQQLAERQGADTRRAMETARVALVGHALGQRSATSAGHLPCPDMRSPGTGGVANDGLEDRLADGRCAVLAGNLPWRTLGLAETDAWGNRLGYAVAPRWAGTTTDAQLLQVCEESRCEPAMAAAAILISHGRNGHGAINSGNVANLPPTSAEERENADGDSRFILRAPRASDRPGGEFDDILLPLSADWLRGRLCDPAALCAGG